MFELYARRLALALVIVGTMALIGAPAAAGQSVADAACPGPGEADLSGANGDYRLAQTFTAQTTGNLTDAQVELNQTGQTAGPTGDWVISINTVNVVGAPTNSVLASATLPDEDVPGGYATVLVTFEAPAPVDCWTAVRGGSYQARTLKHSHGTGVCK